MKNKIAALQILLVFIVAGMMAYGQIKPFTYGPPIGDAYDYLSVAETLYIKGIFTDGNQARDAVATGPHGEGLFFSPGYPALIAGFMMIDPTFKETVLCLQEHRKAKNRADICNKGYGWFLAFQTFLVALTFALIWFGARALSGDFVTSWAAMLIAGASGIISYYAQNFYVEPLLMPLFTAASLGLIYCLKNPRPLVFFVTAILFGLTVLVRPSFTYPFYGFMLVSFMALTWTFKKEHQQRYSRILACLAAALAGYGLTAGIWIFRNGMLFDIWAVSSGYAPFILVQRVAYNMMSWAEAGVAFIYWFPDFGDSLAKSWFAPELYEKLDFADPEGYYALGEGTFKTAAIESAGGREHLLSYLLREHVLGDFAKHAGVTFALLWRGMWIEKYWGLICLPLLLGTTLYKTLKRDYGLLVYAAPALFMAGFHAFVSVSIPRYNIVMIPALSVGAAIALVALGRWFIGMATKKGR